MGGGLEDSIAGGDDADNNQEAEIQDRKLVCMVRAERGVDGAVWAPSPHEGHTVLEKSSS